MTTTRALTGLEQMVIEARAEVAEAQAAVDHCPSWENLQYLETAWARVDRLLDRLPRPRPRPDLEAVADRIVQN